MTVACRSAYDARVAYDQAAGEYDGWFNRPVDQWEDERLAGLLRPLVNGRSVLDLGCGTGWLADHCSPRAYTGVDCSGPMLAELARKHPDAETVKAQVGAPGWAEALPFPALPFAVVTATWSLEYLGGLADLLHILLQVTGARPVLALHGSMPRGHRRRHFSVKAAPYIPLSPPHVRAESRAAGLPPPRCTGTSALPDSWQALGRRGFDAALRAPAGAHYAALWTWQL